MLAEQIAVTMIVTDALEALDVPYAIGGSFASALHGVMRATMDVDLVADLRSEHVDRLAQTLGDVFYADPEMMRDALCHHSSFNVIHLETMFKVDVFVAKPRAFDRSQLARRQLHLLSEDPERYAYVTSAEDIILSKLEWYRMSGGVYASMSSRIPTILTAYGFTRSTGTRQPLRRAPKHLTLFGGAIRPKNG
jgi:hypothetical protein